MDIKFIKRPKWLYKNNEVSSYWIQTRDSGVRIGIVSQFHNPYYYRKLGLGRVPIRYWLGFYFEFVFANQTREKVVADLLRHRYGNSDDTGK